MAIPLEDYEKIFSRPGRLRGKGDEGWELDAEDEAILDRVWAKFGAEREIKLAPVMSDEETLELFGLRKTEAEPPGVKEEPPGEAELRRK